MLPVNRRILIVDDNADIHNDFRKILGVSGRRQVDLGKLEQQLFGEDSDDDFAEPMAQPATPVVYDLDFAYQGEEAVRKVSQAFQEGQPYALVFMDVRMPPGIDGVETISRIWARHPNVEMVICTAYSDYSHDGILTKLGTSDRLLFLSKPFDSIAVKQMALSLSRKWTLHEEERHQLQLLEREATQRRESESRLHAMIHRDRLTGLGNRHQLDLSLRAAIEVARGRHTRFALYTVNLERFNEIIDTLGYQIGDQLIRQVAERLQQGWGEIGSLFRHGDHELSLLVPQIYSLEEPRRTAERLLESFTASFDIAELSIDVQASVGIVVFPDHGNSSDTLFRHGDITSTYARHSELGYCYYDESMNRYSPQRLMLLSDLKSAIQQNDLLLYFQPKLNLANRTVCAAEALIRWAHPVLGFVPPASFIPIAEQCGLIKPLTRWVLRRVARQWCEWHAQGLDLDVIVNLTAYDLQDGELYRRIEEILSEEGMPLERLSLDISERAVMHDREQAVTTLVPIRDMGVKITLDNFGTGYSSLAYLKNLPVGEIKIDASFTENLQAHANEYAIVRSMVELGHNLGLSVSAEGVSSAEVLEILVEFGCDCAQGTYLNAAVPPGEFTHWLETQSRFN